MLRNGHLNAVVALPSTVDAQWLICLVFVSVIIGWCLTQVGGGGGSHNGERGTAIAPSIAGWEVKPWPCVAHTMLQNYQELSP